MEAAQDVPTPVQVAAVQQKTMPIYLTELGTVTAYNTVTIKSRVDGQLMTVNVQEGQRVRKGDLLVQIDPKPYQAASAGLTRRAISAPFSRSTTPMSYCPCKSSQNCGLLPK